MWIFKIAKSAGTGSKEMLSKPLAVNWIFAIKKTRVHSECHPLEANFVSSTRLTYSALLSEEMMEISSPNSDVGSVRG